MHKDQSIICGNMTMLLPFVELVLHKPGLRSCLMYVQFNIDPKQVHFHVLKNGCNKVLHSLMKVKSLL